MPIADRHAGDELLMPLRPVLFRPRHPLGGSLHHHAIFLQGRPHLRLALDGPTQSSFFPTLPVLVVPFLHIDPSPLRITLGAVQVPLDARQEIEVVVDTPRGGQLRAFDVSRGVADSGALCPFFMPSGAGQRACACGAPRAAILGGVSMAGGRELTVVEW